MRREQLWPVVTVPLFPYIKPNHRKPINTRRLRPLDSLNLFRLVSELDACRITTLDVEENPWSVISVFSPYSSEFHVMMMETSTNRYLPSPERMPDNEGERIIGIWLKIAVYLRRQRSSAGRICIGYNWSPRSWGHEEEKTGFQSIPTKWHPMLWSWPRFPEKGQNTESVTWMTFEQLDSTLRRMLDMDNDHAVLLNAIVDKLAPVLNASASNSFTILGIEKKQPTVKIVFGKDLEDLLSTPLFFTKLLKPVAERLNELMVALSESFTDMDCRQIDALIERTVKTRTCEKAVELLRKPPRMKRKDEIHAGLKRHGLPEKLVDVLYEPIRARCRQDGPSREWWRKGFGYALVMGDANDTDHGACIRIMPGIYVGQGGVVEAQGVILKRPEDRALSMEKTREKSEELYTLQQFLEQTGLS